MSVLHFLSSGRERPFFVVGLVVAWGASLAIGCQGTPVEEDESGAPEFAGVAEAEIVGPSSVELRWGRAVDDDTDEEKIVFRVYAGFGGGPVYLGRPVAVSLPGARSAIVSGLTADEYRFVVRAVDEGGEEDDNVSAVHVDLADRTGPEFGGVLGAKAESSRDLFVSWKPAEDDVSDFLALTYRLYASTSKDDVFESAVAETLPGATSTTVEVEETETEYFVAVRAVDESGNEDGNTRVVSTKTLEGVPPDFDGVVSGVATPAGVRLTWVPATDNALASSEILYDVFVSETSGGHNLLAPYVTTTPGVIRWTVTDLDPETEYYFLVRARDRSGNTDKNVRQIAVTTLPPDTTAPEFAGLGTLASVTPKSASLAWEAADDDISETSALVYEVFLSTTDEIDYSSPNRVTAPGRTSLEILGLAPDTTYHAAVRARDEAGNVDDNEIVFEVTTPEPTGDTTTPSISGTFKATAVDSDPSRLLVSWLSLADEVDLISDLRVHVCVGAVQADCEGSSFFENLNVTSAFDSLSVFAVALEPRTTYWVAARVEDRSGNLSSTNVTASALTATSFERNVVPILESRCNQCHDYGYGSLVSVSSGYVDETFGALYRVDSSNPVKSYLVRKLRPEADDEAPFSSTERAYYEGVRMPSDGTDYLAPELEQAVIDWVDQGAFEN